jgi:tripartite-type tricarboxylate transporter receptor subunit TctC
VFSRISTFIIIGLLAAAAGTSQAFPDRTITVIVPFSAGTTTDVNARDFAQVLSASVKQPVVIDNRVGAEGTLGGLALIHAAADGHTLMFTSSSLPVLDPLMKKNMPYDPVKDFAPVCAVGRTSNVMNITGSSTTKNVADVIAAAKAEPGKLTFGYASATMRLAGELFQQAAGVKFTAVPYRSSVTALTDLASGQIDMVFIDHVSATPFYQSGKVRPIAVSGAQRFKALPDVPSATEAGVPGYLVLPWLGIFMSAKTPPAILRQVREAVARALSEPAMAANLDKRGLIPFTLCGDDLAKHVQDEMALWRQVLGKAGIEPQ